jgi:hypothetical protein
MRIFPIVGWWKNITTSKQIHLQNVEGAVLVQ